MVSCVKKIKNEYLGRTIVTIFGFSIIIITLMILGFLGYKGSATFISYRHTISQFLFSTNFNPGDAGATGTIGSAVFVVGSLEISLLALVFALPFSLAVAIFMTEISPQIGKKFVRPIVEIFVGIPSVVYGWIGLSVLVPFMANLFHLTFGFSVLSGAIVLAVMIFPTITSVAADALAATPSEYKEISYALGSTRWQMIWKVKLRAAKSGIITGVVLGLARAMGEALAVAMVIGQSNKFASSILQPTNNLTAVITANMGNTTNGSEYNDVLWSMACLLLLISMAFIVIIRIANRKEKT